MNILILATAKNSLAVKRLTFEAKKRKHQVLVVNPLDLFLLLSNSEAGYDRVYYVAAGKVQKLNVKDIDCVVPRLGENTNYGAFLVEHFHHNLRIFSTNPAEGIRTAGNQLKTLQKLSSSGLPIPKTVYAQNPKHIEHLLKAVGGYPAICKILHSSGGSGVSLLQDKRTAIPILQSLFKSKSSVILQEYLPANGKDYRCIVIGNQVVACMERSASRGDFRANLKQKGSGKAFHLSEEEKALAISATKAAGLYTAGIDLIKANGRWHVLEINANWGWESERITGINYSELLIKYCEQNYQKQVPEKVRVVNYEKLLAEERKQNDKLLNSIKDSNARYRSLLSSSYIREVMRKAKGHNVIYRDRDNNRCEITVNTIEDLFKIMTDTFQIK